MVNNKLEYSVLEVTSHGLDQNRNFGIKFDIGVLTNITHEHLDYHKTFENYVRAKAKLFQNSKVCIINRNYFNFFKKYIKNDQKVILYDRNTLDGKLLEVVRNKFDEDYNVLNATVAALVAREVGIPEKKIIKAIKEKESSEEKRI
jgi:UDP-N-acetylmuramyl tripeptide synthase